MKRTFTKLAQLQKVAQTLAGRAKDARARYDLFQSEVADLDKPAAKQAYQPQHILKLKAERRTAGHQAIRDYLAEMKQIVEPVFRERSAWSKATRLREARFASVPDSAIAKEDRLFCAITELLDLTKRSQAQLWARDLHDDELLSEMEEAVDLDDKAMLSVLHAEARRRQNGFVPIRAQKIIDSIEDAEADEAHALFTEMERAVDEAESLERAIFNPANTEAQRAPSYFDWARRRKEEREKAEKEIELTQEPSEEEKRAQYARKLEQAVDSAMEKFANGGLPPAA